MPSAQLNFLAGRHRDTTQDGCRVIRRRSFARTCWLTPISSQTFPSFKVIAGNGRQLTSLIHLRIGYKKEPPSTSTTSCGSRLPPTTSIHWDKLVRLPYYDSNAGMLVYTSLDCRRHARLTLAVTFDTDYIRYVGVSNQGHGGVELWISRVLPFTEHNGVKGYFNRSDATVLHAEPEILIVEATFGGIPSLCAVAHAPHRGHPAQAIILWWQRFQSLLQSFQTAKADSMYWCQCRYRWVWALQRTPLCSRGWYCWIPTTILTTLILIYVHLPHLQTSIVVHQKHGTVPKHTHPATAMTTSCWAAPFFNIVSCRLSHQISMLAISRWTTLRLSLLWIGPHRYTDHPSPKSNGIARNYNMQMKRHGSHSLKDGRMSLGRQTLRRTCRSSKHIYMTASQSSFRMMLDIEETHAWMGILWIPCSKRSSSKKTLATAKKQCDHHRLHAALTCWNRRQLYGIKLQEILCVIRTIWRWRRYGTLTRSIKQMILQQRAQWLDHQIAPLQLLDRKSALMALKPLRMGKRVKDLGKKPLQQVKLPDDQLALTPAEAMNRWRQHFADLEGGKQVTLQQLWEEAMHRLRQNPHPPEHIDEIPTLLEVERHLQHAAVGKAMGCDLLPGELMRMAAPWMAEAIWPLVVKTALWADEPLQHKGGRLVVAYKGRGDHAQCSSHRSLLVSSSLGKCLHNVWRARTQPYVFKGATAMQFIAQPKALVTQASHCVRMFLRSQIARGRSCYAMFLDIQAAYYRLIRQHSINSDFSDASILQFLERMGVTGLSIQDLATILQGPNALEEMSCPQHLQKIVATLHDSTWWRLHSDEVVVRTERGTRPGDGFADVVWQLCFSRYLHRVDEILASLGIQCQLPWNQCIGFSTGSGDTSLPLGTVVWADDAALLGSTDTADQAIPQLQIVAEVALKELEKLGMQPNMGKGKTEALLHLTGRGSRRVRQYLHHHCGSKIRFTVGQDELALRIIPTYIHLGGVVTHDGSMKVEIKRKLAMAHTTIDNYKAKVLNNVKVPLAMRVHVYMHWYSGYGLGTWPPLSKGELQTWTSGVLRLYKRLLLRHFTADEQRRTDSWRFSNFPIPKNYYMLPDWDNLLCASNEPTNSFGHWSEWMDNGYKKYVTLQSGCMPKLMDWPLSRHPCHMIHWQRGRTIWWPRRRSSLGH